MSNEEELIVERFIEDIREEKGTKIRITSGFTNDIVPLEVFVAQEWTFKSKGSYWEKTKRRIVIPGDVVTSIGRYLKRTGVI